MKQYYAFEWTNGVGNYDSNFHNLPIGLLHFFNSALVRDNFVLAKTDVIALKESDAMKLLEQYQRCFYQKRK